MGSWVQNAEYETISIVEESVMIRLVFSSTWACIVRLKYRCIVFIRTATTTAITITTTTLIVLRLFRDIFRCPVPTHCVEGGHSGNTQAGGGYPHAQAAGNPG